MEKMHGKEKQGGFTLLEVIIAIGVLTIGILAVASMQMSSIRGNAFAGATSEATTWAVDRIEKLIVLPYDDAALDPSGNPHSQAQGRYTVTWNVTADSIISGTKTVDVAVTWSDHGAARKVTMSFTLGQVV